MEHRGPPDRKSKPGAGAEKRGSAAGVPGRRGAERQRDAVPVTERLPRQSRPAGGSGGRTGTADNSQPGQDLLRTTKHNYALINRADQELLIESLNTGIALLDGTNTVTYLNPAAESLLGVSRLRAIGRELSTLLPEGRDLDDLVQRTAESGQVYTCEIQIAPSEKTGHDSMLDCRASMLLPVIGESSRLLEMTDVTQRTRINRENALILQHGTGRQMIRQLAHEIKNPLGGLRGAAQLLARQLDSDDLKEYTTVIISEADRLAALVDTLLGPGGPPNKTPANIHELLDHVARLTTAECGARITIERDYDPGLPLLELDRDLIIQALLNLVKNAVAAMPEKGTLLLRTRAANNFMIGDVRHRAVASVEIEDSGSGIARDLQASIFYPLVTNRVDGTGLGLPVAQEIVSRHAGLIEFESRPGRTVFFVRLPIGADKHG